MKHEPTMTSVDTDGSHPGIYVGMRREDYDAIDAANQSTLKTMLKASPAHARHEKLFPKEVTDSKILGTAWHMLFLQGRQRFQSNYTIWEGKTRRGKEWDAFKEAAEDDGKIILTKGQADACFLMALSLREHETAARLFNRLEPTHGIGETVLIWDEPREIGKPIRCKAMLDHFITDDSPTIPDLKSASSTVPQDLERAIANFGYDFQGAFYRRGAAALSYPNANIVLCFLDTGGSGATPKPTIVNADDEERYPVRVVELDEKALARGDQFVDAALDLWRMCQSAGKWGSYPDQIESISVPQWAINEMNR